MEPIRTSYAKSTLRGEGCLDLPAAIWPDPDGGPAQVETAWKPTPEELADLMDGGTVYLYQLIPAGHGFPPVLLTTRSQVAGTPEALEEAARAERREGVEA